MLKKILEGLKRVMLAHFILLLVVSCLTPSIGAKSNEVDIPAMDETQQVDDSQKIIQVIEKELPVGVISVEQESGRLMHNPTLHEIKAKPNKEHFYLPAMIVNNKHGIKLIQNAPLSCFIIASTELLDQGYRSFRQHEILRYIREVKAYAPDKVMICEVSEIVKADWKKHIKLQERHGNFIFEDYISLNGEHFYYYINDSGNFEMYF